MSWVYEAIHSLWTPCGEIVVVDERQKRRRFSVKQNPYRPDYYLHRGTEREEILNTDTNYLLCIHTGDLILNRPYQIRLMGGPLHVGSSDEHTEAVSGTSHGYSMAIGAYDPNDEEKMQQAYAYSLRRRAFSFYTCRISRL